MNRACQLWSWVGSAVLFCGVLTPSAFPQDVEDLKKELQELRDQNHILQTQLQQQQQMINQLTRKFSDFQKTNESLERSVRSMEVNEAAGTNAPPPENKGFSVGNVAITGEGGVGIFETGQNGKYPNAAFRVDEARLFFDTPVWDDVFFHAQVDLVTPQADDTGLYFGELYLEFENIVKHWNLDDVFNARLGNIYIPFGEEYEYRFAIDDPLISHSLSDLWGYNPGLELYGSWRQLSYAVAVQDGGISPLNDNTGDKSVAGRISYDPTAWLHFSGSAMRTGDLSVAADGVSAIWFGGGLFSSIGSPATTSTFRVGLSELDASGKWKGGYLKVAGGYAAYDDNNTAADDHRDIYYYYVEGLQHLTRKLYGVTRFSQIRAPNSYPIEGDTATFGLPTSDLWRLSLGLGYTLNDHLVLKAEYMIERGELSTGEPRDHEDMIAAEAAFKF